jgi:hypothetical protein
MGGLYLATDIATCLWEVFGDEVYETHGLRRLATERWINQAVSQIQVAASLKICDLTSVETRSACGVDLASIVHPTLDYPHAWARAIAEHPKKYDAILYESRFTSKKCLVIYDRAAGKAIKPIDTPATLRGMDEAERFLLVNHIALV